LRENINYDLSELGEKWRQNNTMTLSTVNKLRLFEINAHPHKTTTFQTKLNVMHPKSFQDYAAVVVDTIKLPDDKNARK